MEHHGVPAWPWPGDRIVVLYRGLFLREGAYVIHKVEAISIPKRKVLLAPIFDLFNLRNIVEGMTHPITGQPFCIHETSFEALPRYNPTLKPHTLPFNDHTWYDAILEEDLV